MLERLQVDKERRQQSLLTPKANSLKPKLKLNNS